MDEKTKSWFEFFAMWARNCFLGRSIQGGRPAVNVYTKDQLDRMTYVKLCAIHKKLEETGRITVRADMKRDKDSLIKRILLKQSAPPKFPKYTSQGLSRMSYAEVKAIHKRFQDAGLITVRKDAKRTCEHLIDRILLAQIKK